MTRNLQTELNMIARILQKRRLCKDTTPITNAIQKNDKGYSCCNIENLEIILPVPGNIIPSNIKHLVAIITVKSDNIQAHETDIVHMFNNYYFNIQFVGNRPEEENRYYSSIHLDYEASDTSNYIHPWFHLTYGGHGVKHIDNGRLMVLPTPRIPIWPMDFILGLDFILSNFLNKEDYNRWFIDDSNYKSSLKNSQYNIWRPYILAIAHHWCKFSNCKHNMIHPELSRNYMPTLIL